MEAALRIRSSTIPAAGALARSGARFEPAGYQALLDWNQNLAVSLEWADDYESLDVRLPCCEADHPFADESRNCSCGHHRALYGSAKRLLSLDLSRSEAQQELDRWRAYFFPRETVQAELERRGFSVGDIGQVLDELQEQGLC